jgi:restriction endonuclease Mrr
VPDATGRLADEFGLTAAEREQLLPSGRQRVLHNRIHWAKFYMGKAGLITSPRRGVFTATDEGRKLLAQKPERIDVKRLLSIPSFAEFYKRDASVAPEALAEASTAASSAAETTPEEQIEAAFGALTTALREDLIARILQNTPSFFEGVIIDLLVAMGYGGSRRDASSLTASGSRSITLSRVCAGPSGSRRWFSQSRRVQMFRPKRAANCSCVSPQGFARRAHLRASPPHRDVAGIDIAPIN